ncbi:MAG: competence/damage-inducible protein A [Cyclobacteriaceae bacterium]|nr:competence/damage-inducible protein A [Cyclobacteriaceae bacterium]
MKQILAEIITIGDEILYGQTLDTNSHWISEALDRRGIKVLRKTTIGDQESEILTAFAEAESRVDLVLITGGLGPTNDDLTKPCLVKFFNTDLVLNEKALSDVAEFFARRGRELTQLNRNQALLPRNCVMIPNRHGTAPGMWFERDNTVFVSMPGVPHEMKHIMEESILPKISAHFKVPALIHKMVKTTGIGESFLADIIKEWEDALPKNIKLAYLPSPGEVKLRLTGLGNDKKALEEGIEREIASLQKLASEYIYGYNGDTLEKVIGELMRNQSKTMAVAESCTGGYLAHMITSVPGSSDYFLGGMVPYSNRMKTELLGIPEELIEEKGAVSEEVVKWMAESVRKKFSADIGLASSGIAGPGGGSAEKPVGTVWIACSCASHTQTKKLQLSLDRNINIKLSSISLLNLLRKQLIQ